MTARFLLVVALLMGFTCCGHAEQVFINFDVDPDGVPIPIYTDISHMFDVWGVTFSAFGPWSDPDNRALAGQTINYISEPWVIGYFHQVTGGVWHMRNWDEDRATGVGTFLQDNVIKVSFMTNITDVGAESYMVAFFDDGTQQEVTDTVDLGIDTLSVTAPIGRHITHIHFSGRVVTPGDGVKFDNLTFVMGEQVTTNLAPGSYYFSVPVEPADPSPADVLSGLGVSGTDWVLRDLIGWRYYTHPDPNVRDFTLGRGYQLQVINDGAVAVAGEVADPAQPFTIDLPVGANMIGCPFDVDVPWDDDHVQVTWRGTTLPLSTAIARGWLWGRIATRDPGGFRFIAPGGGNLEPWRGYLIAARRQGCQLTLSAMNGSASLSVRRARPGILTSLCAVGTSDGGADIVFTLGAEASVDARVLNIAGRPIRQIASARVAGAGINRLHWNGISATGTKAPPGRYLVRIAVRSEDGQATERVTPLMLGN